MNSIRPGEASHEIKSVPDPGLSTLRETLEGLNDNVFEAARREQNARLAFGRLPPSDSKGEIAMKGWETQARSEQAHWRGYYGVYREWMALHPELADKPLGTRCAHGADCTLDSPKVREAGADDETPMIWDDRRLPPERENDEQGTTP